MGVINITQRSERLGNLGGTSAAHGVTSTDIGTVHHTSARTFSPTYYSRNYQEGNRAIGRGLGAAGDTMLRLGLAIRQREEDRQVDEYTNAMMRTMEAESRDERDITDWNTPERQHLQGQKRGFYLRTGKGTMNVAKEWDDCFGERFKQIGVSIGANERVRERTMKNLASYRRGAISRLMDQQASEYRRMELGTAEGTLNTQINLFNDGHSEAIPDIFAQYDRVATLRRLTPEQAKAGKEELALKLAASVIGQQVTGCQTAEDFDRVEADIKSGMKGKLPDDIAANLPGGDRAVGGKMKDALLTDVRRARQSFEIQRDREEREALSELVAFSDNALARGGIEGLEAAQTDMAARAAKMPKGSRMETVALEQAKRLEAAADKEAQRLCFDSILEHADDKTPWEPPKGTRMEKFFGPLKKTFDEQLAAYRAGGLLEDHSALQSQRKQNETTIRAQMMTAASAQPGVFLAQLADSAVKGHITVDQYRKLTDEFNKVWQKEGMPKKAAQMMDVAKEYFGAYSMFPTPYIMQSVAKNGRFVQGGLFDIGLEYNARKVAVESSVGSGEYSSFVTDQQVKRDSDTLTAADQTRLINWALELAKLDGRTTTVDPLTHETLDKPKKIDAVEEFRRACVELRSVTRVRSAQDIVSQAVDALGDITTGVQYESNATVERAARTQAAESGMMDALRHAKRKPFQPKMPKSGTMHADEET